jgi:hypothetical protein
MAFEYDPVLFINLILCIIIVVMGFLCSKRTGENLPLFIAAAFGLFGISHAATLAGLKDALVIPLILIRALAYILVIYALYSYLKDSLTAKETRQAWVDYFRGESDKKDKTV